MSRTGTRGRRVLGVFTLAMINVAAIASLKNLPMMAEYGLALLFYIGVAAFAFFIPTALVAAELATAWPETGGVYVWVKEAFGGRWGFFAIWLQWVENVVWFPTILSFAAAALAYLISPALAGNRLYTFAVILLAFWGSTLLNLRGMKLSGVISSAGAILGTIVPGSLIIGLGIFWILSGGTPQITFSAKNLLPGQGHLHLRHLVLLSGVLLALTGMEMSAVHAREVKNPRRDYPKAILLSVIIILAISVAGSMAIAVVVPRARISLVAGVMEAFEDFFHAYGLDWLTPVVALLTAAGAFAQVSTWIVGPTKGLLATSRDGILPPFFRRVNRHGMPAGILFVQAAILSAVSLVFLFMPSVSSSFWILTALTAQVYLVMYLLMFLAAIRLRCSRPDVPRPYRVPGGRAGIWCVGGLGIIASLFAISIGFLPPAQLASGNVAFYESFLVVGLVVLGAPPLLICRLRSTGGARGPT